MQKVFGFYELPFSIQEEIRNSMRIDVEGDLSLAGKTVDSLIVEKIIDDLIDRTLIIRV